MLEKAIISGVTHTREETVYRVEGIDRGAALRRARRGAASTSTRSSRPAPRDRLLRAASRTAPTRPTCSTGSASTWSARDDLGKVSVVGAGMKSHPGVAAETFATLDGDGDRAEVVTTSPIKIACHVRTRRRSTRAVQALHEAFELDDWRRCASRRIGVVGATGAVGA